MSRTLSLALAVAVIIPAASPAWAQYDRDGRYVPSPMGVPSDPYARPIPTYPGTPGRATGTPVLPRAATPSPPKVKRLQRVEPPAFPSNSRPVSIRARQCAKGWSRSTGLSRKEFRRLCNKLRRR